MTSATLGPRYEEELEILVETGVYNNKSEALRHAVDRLYESLSPERKMNVAIHAYQTRGFTVTRAAELARTSYEGMRDRLVKESLLRTGAPTDPATHVEERRSRAKSLGAKAKDK